MCFEITKYAITGCIVHAKDDCDIINALLLTMNARLKLQFAKQANPVIILASLDGATNTTG